MERQGGFYWVRGHALPVVAEYCGGYWLFSGADEWRSDDGTVEVLSDRLIPPSDGAAGSEPEGRPCPATDSGGTPCEKLAGHEGGHACPEALARFHARRAPKHIRIP